MGFDVTQTTPVGADRRAEPRKPLHVRAKVLVAGRVFEVRTFDISKAGIGIYAEVNPKAGVEVELQFGLLAQQRQIDPVKVRAKVVHSVFAADGRGFKVGLIYTQMDDASRAAIHRFLR